MFFFFSSVPNSKCNCAKLQNFPGNSFVCRNFKKNLSKFAQLNLKKKKNYHKYFLSTVNLFKITDTQLLIFTCNQFHDTNLFPSSPRHQFKDWLTNSTGNVSFEHFDRIYSSNQQLRQTGTHLVTHSWLIVSKKKNTPPQPRFRKKI